jgi:hypothetical protein
MNYTFRVDRLIPKSEFMSVTYMADGYPDFRRNFSLTDFSKEALESAVADFAPNVVHFWERQEGHPESVSFTGGSGVAEAPVPVPYDPKHVPTIEPEPEYDPFSQYLTMNPVVDPMQETVGWTVNDMTAEEQAENLSKFRAGFSVQISQFKQAIYDRGIMESVEAMAATSVTAQILWESADFVSRGSSRVQAALSMTEEELDEFFIYASTLDSVL